MKALDDVLLTMEGAASSAPASSEVLVVRGADEAAPSMFGAWLSLRDALLATCVLIALIVVGSGGGEHLDPALFGYLGATLVATFALTWRVSAFWRRPATAFYGRALLAALRDRRHLPRVAADAGRDLAAQEFIRQRSTARWFAHLLLSLGTLASFAITLPLVFGWMHFVPAGERAYRTVVFNLPTLRFDVEGLFGWLLFHGLSLSAVAVTFGAVYFLATRLRVRRLPGATAGFAIAPLVLLLVVALTGLALPASRGWPAAFRIAAWLHQASVIVLLLALPFSKLNHIFTRPLQLGARAVRATSQAWRHCAACSAPLAPVAQQQEVAALLRRRGIEVGTRLDHCPTCRRRQLAVAQAGLMGAQFQPSPFPRSGGRSGTGCAEDVQSPPSRPSPGTGEGARSEVV